MQPNFQFLDIHLCAYLYFKRSQRGSVAFASMQDKRYKSVFRPDVDTCCPLIVCAIRNVCVCVFVVCEITVYIINCVLNINWHINTTWMKYKHTHIGK